jgi:hypothetical protein
MNTVLGGSIFCLSSFNMFTAEESIERGMIMNGDYSRMWNESFIAHCKVKS